MNKRLVVTTLFVTTISLFGCDDKTTSADSNTTANNTSSNVAIKNEKSDINNKDLSTLEDIKTNVLVMSKCNLQAGSLLADNKYKDFMSKFDFNGFHYSAKDPKNTELVKSLNDAVKDFKDKCIAEVLKD